MASVTRELQITNTVPAAKLFKVTTLEGDTLLPKILPQTIRSIETNQGNGGPGTIKKFNFGNGKYGKKIVDLIDTDNFAYTITTFEGEPWIDGLDKVSFEFKFVPSPDGGSIFKSVNKYYAKGGSKLNEAQIKAVEETLAGIAKAVEAYCLANP